MSELRTPVVRMVVKAAVLDSACHLHSGGVYAESSRRAGGSQRGPLPIRSRFFYLALALSFAHFRRGPLLGVALWLFAFGVALEVAQLFVSGRSGEFSDLAIDAAGIGFGCVVYAWLLDFKVATI